MQIKRYLQVYTRRMLPLYNRSNQKAMNVFFYEKEDGENSILQYETCPYNNIPRIGEEVIIKNKWYLVENIVNRYKKLTNFTFTDVYVYLKELEDK